MPLLLPPAVASSVRPTDDVDCVVQVATTLDYYRLGDRLRELGFSQCRDEGAPLCRWVVEDIRVDIMPSGESALGFRNLWFEQVLVNPQELRLSPALRIKVANLATFLATKFDAFADRGHGSYYGDADIEDVVTVLAYCSDAVCVVDRSPREVRAYLAERSREFLSQASVVDVVSGCFSPEPTDQALVPIVLERLRLLASCEPPQAV